MYESSRSAVLLEGEQSAAFNVEQGVAQGCSLSPIPFSVFINGLLKEVEQAELGITKYGSTLFPYFVYSDDHGLGFRVHGHTFGPSLFQFQYEVNLRFDTVT